MVLGCLIFLLCNLSVTGNHAERTSLHKCPHILGEIQMALTTMLLFKLVIDGERSSFDSLDVMHLEC